MRSIGVCMLREARRIERDLAYDIEEEEREAAERNGMPLWSEVTSSFLLKKKGDAANEMYLSDLQRYFRRFSEAWGDPLVSEISVEMVKAFRSDLRDAGKSKATCDRHLAAGRAAWNYSLKGKLPNPFTDVPNYNPRNEVTRYLSDDERVRLLKACRKVSQHLYEIVQVALATGLRKRNIVELRRDQVNFTDRTITVRQKGDRPHTVVFGERLARMLASIPENGTDYFWISTRTGKPYHKDWRRVWLKAKQLAGLPVDFRFHDLRHDAGTRAYAQTNDIRAANVLLGHSSLKMTERYAHILPERLRAVAVVMDSPEILDDKTTDEEDSDINALSEEQQFEMRKSRANTTDGSNMGSKTRKP